MQTVKNLHQRGFLTDQQLLVAYKFSRNPLAYSLAPSMFRVLNELVIEDRSVGDLEAERGWPARSAKAILSVLLNCLLEIGGTHLSEAEVTAQEMLDFVTGEDVTDVVAAQEQFSFTKVEARLFCILKNATTSVCTTDYIMRSLYGDDGPDSKIISVLVCRMRNKLRSRSYNIITHRGVGFSIQELENSGDVKASNPPLGRSASDVVASLSPKLSAYALHIEMGYSVRDAADLLCLKSGSTVLRAVRAVEDARDDPEVDAIIASKVNALVRRWREKPILVVGRSSA